jgi:uncharacterized membrane protein
VVKQSEQDAEIVAALHALTHEIRSIKQNKSPSTVAIIGVIASISAIVGVALVVVVYIVNISMSHAAQAGEIKTLRNDLEYARSASAELKERVEAGEKRADDAAKQIQGLREMYFIEFGKRPDAKP